MTAIVTGSARGMSVTSQFKLGGDRGKDEGKEKRKTS